MLVSRLAPFASRNYPKSVIHRKPDSSLLAIVITPFSDEALPTKTFMRWIRKQLQGCIPAVWSCQRILTTILKTFSNGKIERVPGVTRLLYHVMVMCEDPDAIWYKTQLQTKNLVVAKSFQRLKPEISFQRFAGKSTSQQVDISGSNSSCLQSVQMVLPPTNSLIEINSLPHDAAFKEIPIHDYNMTKLSWHPASVSIENVLGMLKQIFWEFFTPGKRPLY